MEDKILYYFSIVAVFNVKKEKIKIHFRSQISAIWLE